VTVSGKGSLAWSRWWLPAVVLVCVLLGCGSDLPPNTGGGTISGHILYSGKYYSGGKITGLERPWLMVFASFDSYSSNVTFQATFMVPCSEFPEEGIYYELKGLYPSNYYIVAAMSDWSRDDWATPFSFGGYKSVLDLEKVKVTSTAGTMGIDFKMFDPY
jgi:hypothetical protein